MNERLRVGIVGGSIAGCVTAAALLQHDIDVEVLERSSSDLGERGAGITLPQELVREMKRRRLLDSDFDGANVSAREWRVPDGTEDLGRLAFKQAMHDSQMQHWGVLLNNLRKRVPEARYIRGAMICTLRQDQAGVTVASAAGDVRRYELIIGADGYRSTVRRLVLPGAIPTYAGYPAWRGAIEERLIRKPEAVAKAVQMVGVPRGHASLYMIPGVDGNVAPGNRRVNWLIYDAAAPPEVTGARQSAAEGAVHAVPPGGLTKLQAEYLHALAQDHLPPWHADVVLSTTSPYMQTMHDLLLDTSVVGRVCLVGDAAMIARPHTGSGASKAVRDALCLADALAGTGSVQEGLGLYRDGRVPSGNALVRLGRDLGRELVLDAPDWRSLDESGYATLITSGATSRTYFAGRGRVL